jgi:proteasome component ECM29
VEVIVELMRTGVGLPTLSGCARLVVTLATGPCRNHLTPYTSALSRVLLSGLMDQSPSIRKAYANALGYACKVSKRKRVAKTITDLLALYTSPHLASEAGTEKGRLVSGLALRAVVRRATDHAKEFASGNLQ